MTFTEEEQDHLAAMRVRARREGQEEERAKNDAVNAKKAEFLRSHNVPEDLISATQSIK